MLEFVLGFLGGAMLLLAGFSALLSGLTHGEKNLAERAVPFVFLAFSALFVGLCAI